MFILGSQENIVKDVIPKLEEKVPSWTTFGNVYFKYF